MTRQRPTQLAHAAYIDAHTIATYIDQAISAMKQARGGYPSSTAGASPPTPAPYNPDHHDDDDDAVDLTVVERNALTPDPAARDLTEFNRRLERASGDLAWLAVRAMRWAIPAADESTVKRRLAAVTADSGLWCRNHLLHGHSEVRAEGRTECDWCRAFRARYGVDAPKSIVDARLRYSMSENLIHQLLDRDVPGWRKKAPKKKKAG